MAITVAPVPRLARGAERQLDMVFLLDPLESLTPTRDTTTYLMRAAQEAGHRIWTGELSDLSLRGRHVHAQLRRTIFAAHDRPGWYRRTEHVALALDDVAAIFLRTDPPVDDRYLHATYMLDLVDRQRVIMVNDPTGVRNANEKLYSLQFPEWVPATLVSADVTELRAFVEAHRIAVLKPVDGCMGRDVFQLRQGDANVPSLLETATDRGRRVVIAQEFLGDVVRGNRRIFLLGGAPLAAVDRFQAPGDFRIGDAHQPAQLTDEESALCAAMAARLCADGLRFVGLDVIAGRLIEVNVTSPGAVRHFDAATRSWLATRVINHVAAAHLAAAAQ